jgi:hypothetical protein
VTTHVAASGLPKESGYTHGFLLLGLATLAAALAGLLIPAVRRNAVTHLEPSVELAHAELALVAGGTVVGDESE